MIIFLLIFAAFLGIFQQVVLSSLWHLNLKGWIPSAVGASVATVWYFNESMNNYNIGINELPKLILVRLLGYHRRELLDITEEETHYNGTDYIAVLSNSCGFTD